MSNNLANMTEGAEETISSGSPPQQEQYESFSNIHYKSDNGCDWHTSTLQSNIHLSEPEDSETVYTDSKFVQSSVEYYLDQIHYITTSLASNLVDIQTQHDYSSTSYSLKCRFDIQDFKPTNVITVTTILNTIKSLSGFNVEKKKIRTSQIDLRTALSQIHNFDTTLPTTIDPILIQKWNYNKNNMTNNTHLIPQNKNDETNKKNVYTNSSFDEYQDFIKQQHVDFIHSFATMLATKILQNDHSINTSSFYDLNCQFNINSRQLVDINISTILNHHQQSPLVCFFEKNKQQQQQKRQQPDMFMRSIESRETCIPIGSKKNKKGTVLSDNSDTHTNLDSLWTLDI